MKKAEIISSKHVDHIENEKKILEKIVHPFAVSRLPHSMMFKWLLCLTFIFSCLMMASSKTIDTFTSPLSCSEEVISSPTTEDRATSMSNRLSKLQ